MIDTDVSSKPFRLISYIDGLLSKLRTVLSEQFFVSNENWLFRYGYIAALIFSVHALLVGIWAAIKVDSFSIFVSAIGVSIGSLLILYVSTKLMPSVLALVKNSPSTVSSPVIFDIMALLCFMLGTLTLIFMVYSGIQSGSSSVVFSGVGTFISLCYVASIFFNPSLISVSVSEKTSPALEGLSVLSSFIKAGARVVIINFGSWLIIGECSLIVDTFAAISDKHSNGVLALFQSATSHLSLIGAGLFIAMITYFTFIASMFLLQITEAILIIPDRFLGLSKVIALTAKTGSKTPAP
ncbi:MAG: hypothetical protein ACOH2R_09345 [Pseudomonas sp.]